MKEYFSNRNEQLLKKLFEHQKITVKEIGVPEMTAWQAHVTDESERQRIEEDFKSILQETWLAEGNRALTEQELETALQSIISEKFDPDKTKIGDTDKTVQQLALAVDLKKDDSGKATAEPSQEEKIEELIKKVLSNTDDRIRALGEFYHILTKRENEANEKLGAEEAPSPEEEKEEVKEKVKDALEDEGNPLAPTEKDSEDAEKELGSGAAVVPLTKGKGGSLRKMLSNPKLGLDKKIQIKILRAMKGQLQGSNIQFAESDAIEEMSKDVKQAKKKAKKRFTADAQKFKAFVGKNPQIQQLLSKIDTIQDIKGFMLAIVEILQTENSPEEIIKVLSSVLPIVKKDAQQGAGEVSAAGELNLQTSRNEIDYSGILDYLKASKVDPAVTKNVSKVIKTWYKRHLADKDVKLTEDSERFFSSMLESFKAINRDLRALKTETHAIAVPDDDSEELDTGEELDAMELDDTEELEIDDEKLEEEKNPYAICTASVGREDEKKYKSCKDKVAAKNKK